MKHTPPFLLCSILALTSLAQSQAAVVTWDSSTTGGSWGTPSAWLGGSIPSDEALLGNVTSGTRTVSVSDPTSLVMLSMTQNTIGATNRLEISNSLTLSGTTSPFKLTSGGAGATVEIAVQNSGLLRSERAGNLTANLNASFTVASSGKIEVVSTGGSATATLSGPTQNSGTLLASSIATSTAKVTLGGTFTAEATGKVEARGGGGNVEITGNAHLKAGSDILIQYASNTGAAQFSNSGILLMDSASITYDWAAAADGNGTRNFVNSGTWTLANNSSVKLITSTGRQIGGGFTTFTTNSNSGTLKAQSGSTLILRTLYNTGILEAGSATANVSDANVVLGTNQITTGITLTNGLTSAGTAQSGTVAIKGNATLGHTSDIGTAGTTLLNNGSASSTGSLVKIGDDTTPLTFTIGASTASEINNFAGNRLEVRSNATLDMKVYTPSGSASASTKITNAGTLLHSGTIKLQGNLSSGSKTITNSSSYYIGGTAATLVNNINSNGTNSASAITFNNTGTLQGNTASDRLTYSNLSTNAARDILTIATSNGTLVPGSGTGSASTVGALELVNTSLTFTGESKLTLDIAGTSASDAFDTLTLSGSGAAINLGSNTALDIHLAEGATLEGTYRIINAVTISGAFSQLLLNGASALGHYSVDIQSTHIDLVAVPEPNTLFTIAGAASLLLLFRGRKRQL